MGLFDGIETYVRYDEEHEFFGSVVQFAGAGPVARSWKSDLPVSIMRHREVALGELVEEARNHDKAANEVANAVGINTSHPPVEARYCRVHGNVAKTEEEIDTSGFHCPFCDSTTYSVFIFKEESNG